VYLSHLVVSGDPCIVNEKYIVTENTSLVREKKQLNMLLQIQFEKIYSA